VNELTGEPIAQLPYKLTTAGGDIEYGVTDEYGKTTRIATVDQEVVRVEWGVTAPSPGT
jgi:type VI secretion system secreted protein VgrG